ncbi:uncharacterized protein LOC142319857 [Lycorma delicatula]|uniref:uncharacterized protein LOC142319857 n=1 Tax=Lycorma delicatula TaxID=130591 RepID=UPI003F519FA4
MTDIANYGLENDSFPRCWREAKLVFLPKGGDDQGLSRFRRLSPLNNLDKAVEKMLANRIVCEIEEGVGISVNQFGFWKGRSTVLAAKKVTTWIADVRRGTWGTRGIPLLVFLDVKNAFGSIKWSHIHSALLAKNISPYLRRQIGWIMVNPRKLYHQCLDVLVPILEKLESTIDWDNDSNTTPLDKLAAVIVEDLLVRASLGKTRWNDSWRIFLTPKIRFAILDLEESLLKFVALRCKALKRVCFPWCKTGLDANKFSLLPPTVSAIDFDTEENPLDLSNLGELVPANWLPEAALLHKSLWALRRKPVEGIGLTEVHLTGVSVGAPQLCTIIKHAPSLRLLEHYQLVRALYNLHAQQWRQSTALPRYKLLNLDADFSHVVRSHLSPLAVLPSDALRLATALCPDACYVRLRFDPNTPHDVLQPLISLHRLKELSTVCVSSGERCLLDFSDIAPLLEHHGPKSLQALELKVIEEVDPHVILLNCQKLENLVLSGCGFVTPSSCPSHGCSDSNYVLPSPRLRLLFYADGDDFSWTHHMPQCFWRATLNFKPERSYCRHGKKNRLKGLFLESPRMWDETATWLWESQKVLYPELQILSVCRYPELSIPQLQSILRGAPIRYLRSVSCEKLHPRRVQQLFKNGEVVVNAE